MLTLSYGIQKPQAPDKGGTFFPALENNAQKQNDHTHDGVTSAPIPTQNLTKSSQSILAAGWVSAGNRFRQLVTLPAGFTYANTVIRFSINGGTYDGETIFPSVEKGGAANQYYVYTNDNTLALTALYV